MRIKVGDRVVDPYGKVWYVERLKHNLALVSEVRGVPAGWCHVSNLSPYRSQHEIIKEFYQ